MTDRPASADDPATANAALLRVRDSFSRQGLVGTLGAWLVELASGHAAIEIPFSKRVAGQSGRFHTAVVAGVAQACGGTAAATLVPSGVDIAPAQIELAYDGCADGDVLRAEATATNMGGDRWSVAVIVSCRSGERIARCAAGSLVFEARSAAD